MTYFENFCSKPSAFALAVACSLLFGYGFSSAAKLLAFPLSLHTPLPSGCSLDCRPLLTLRVRFQLCGKAPRFPALASHTKSLKVFACWYVVQCRVCPPRHPRCANSHILKTRLKIFYKKQILLKFSSLIAIKN